MAAFYLPPAHYTYYEPPPPSPPGAVQPPPAAVPQPLHQQYLPNQPQLVTYAPPVYPQSSQDEPFAFAVFVDQQSAIMALHALNGMVFDLEKGSTLYIDLAKSNPQSKRLRTGVGSIHMPGMGNSAYNTNAYPSIESLGNLEATGANVSNAKLNAIPCPTLFVASLGPTCSEQELIQVFSRCHGFLKLKMQSTYGAPVAFVDFQDTACSTEVLTHLQGTVLYSFGIWGGDAARVYAKSRMGMRSKKSR